MKIKTMTAHDQVLMALHVENQVIQPDQFRKALLESWLIMEEALDKMKNDEGRPGSVALGLARSKLEPFMRILRIL